MGKKLNKKGVKYASDEVCKACNLIIKGDAFYCFDCKNSIHAICTGLSRETKLLYFVTNRTFSSNCCIKQKDKYNEAVIWLDKLKESENKEQDLLNPPPAQISPISLATWRDLSSPRNLHPSGLPEP